MTKRFYTCTILLLLILLLLLTACGSAPPAPSPTPEPAGSGEPLYLLYSGDTWDGVVLQGGQVLARGDVGLTTDAASGQAAGYYIRTPVQEADGPTYHYTLYRPDGTLWLDCGTQEPSQALGRWISLSSVGFYEATGHFIDPDTGETRLDSYYLVNETAPGQYLLASYAYEDPAPPLLVDEDLNVLTEFTSWTYAYVYAGDPFLTLSRSYEDEEGYHNEYALYDLTAGEFLNYDPYDSATLPGGYLQVQRLSDDPEAAPRYDILDPDGKMVVRNTEERHVFYTPHLQAVENGAGDGITLHGACEGEVCRDIGMLGENIYLLFTDGEFRLLDAEGHELSRTMTHPEVFTSATDGLLLLEWPGMAQLWSPDGLLWEQTLGDEEMIYLSQLYSAQGADGGTRYRLYHYYGTFSSTSLLDENGGVLLDGLSLMYTTGVPGVYQVRKGFERGLMNEAGEWLWSESIFTDATDEIDDMMW
ncbi:MAG: DUF5046 domain-containing protein [Oscillospiraceae bacterium]|nr:DUF5046 domain-containing protein [Oscillospiraceae bacterium]